MADTWDTKASLPSPAQRYGMALGDAVVDGKLYAVCGFASGSHLTDLDIYDPSGDSWSAGTNFPGAARRWASVGAISGKLYVAGGQGAARYKNGWYYTPGSDSWTAIADATAEFSQAPGAVHGGYLYLCGQLDNTGSVRAYLWRYDPAANSWNTSLASMPAAKSGGGAAVIGDYIYVAGGSTNGIGSGAVATLYRYDINGDSWTTLTAMPAARQGPSIAAVAGKLYVAGGQNTSANGQVSTYEYDPGGDSWTTMTSIPLEGRGYSAFGVIGDQYLHVAGGWRTSASFSSLHHRYNAADLVTAGWAVGGQILG